MRSLILASLLLLTQNLMANDPFAELDSMSSSNEPMPSNGGLNQSDFKVINAINAEASKRCGNRKDLSSFHAIKKCQKDTSAELTDLYKRGSWAPATINVKPTVTITPTKIDKPKYRADGSLVGTNENKAKYQVRDGDKEKPSEVGVNSPSAVSDYDFSDGERLSRKEKIDLCSNDGDFNSCVKKHGALKRAAYSRHQQNKLEGEVSDVSLGLVKNDVKCPESVKGYSANTELDCQSFQISYGQCSEDKTLSQSQCEKIGEYDATTKKFLKDLCPADSSKITCVEHKKVFMECWGETKNAKMCKEFATSVAIALNSVRDASGTESEGAFSEFLKCVGSSKNEQKIDDCRNNVVSEYDQSSLSSRCSDPDPVSGKLVVCDGSVTYKRIDGISQRNLNGGPSGSARIGESGGDSGVRTSNGVGR